MQKQRKSNFNETNPLVILNKFDKTVSLLLITLAIYPRNAETGMLEEKGEWIRQVWSYILEISDEIQGCRLLWSQLFFVADAVNQYQITSEIKVILERMKNSDLQSLCVIGKVQGTSEGQVKLLDEMLHKISSKKDFDIYDPDLVRLVDGKDLDN